MIESIAHTDPGKQFVATDSKGKLQAFYVPDFQYTALGKFIIYRLTENRDVKVVITGSGKTTGTGKTTLAIHLARWINRVRNYLIREGVLTCWFCDRPVREDGVRFTADDTDELGVEAGELCHDWTGGYEWSAEDYAFVSIWDYLEKYRNSNPGDPLISDELEYMFDRRDSMKKGNKDGSKALSVLRYKNVVTIGTAPGLWDLDKRWPEAADVWINVVFKGCANDYYMTVDDFTGERIVRRMRTGGHRESLLWNPIENDDDYKWLKRKKAGMGVPGIDAHTGDTTKTYKESDLNELQRQLRDEDMKRLIRILHELDVADRMTQTELGRRYGVSQQTVSKLYKQAVADGELPEGVF